MTSLQADYLVGEWRISPMLNRISKGPETVSVKHKSMAVLNCLANANGEVLSRNAIMDAVWPGMAVTDDVLTQSIVELRKAFTDDAKHPKVIETIPRVGFRLIAKVAPVAGEPTPAPATDPNTDPLTRTLESTKVNPDQSRYYWIAAAIVLVCGIALWAVLFPGESNRKPVITVQDRPSIAVLPFVNMSDDPGNEYFSDGLSEEILILLTKISGLKVIGRTSSFAFKGKNEDLRIIGQTLGVKTVLEGSVRKSGERIRITAQLVDVSDGAHIWAQTYDRKITDIFEVQEDVAAAIIDALQIHVSTAPARGRPTTNSIAYSLFLKAKIAVSASEWRDAEDLLLSAIDLDPNFAEAFEMLAYTYWGLAGWAIEGVEAQRLVGEAAAKAIAIDPDMVLAKALNAAAIFGPHIRWRKLQAFEAAARIQPDSPYILETFVFSLTENGYLEEALRWAERYVELDPLSPMANTYWSAALYAVGRTRDAITAMEFLNRREMPPNTFEWTIDGIYVAEKRDEAAIAQFVAYVRQLDTDATWVRELVTGARDPSSGQAYLDRRIPQLSTAMSKEDLNSLYLFFGFLDRYYELIFSMEPSESTWHNAGVHLWRGNIFRRTGFTAHPKYLDLTSSLGTVESWEQRGPPDFCQKFEGQWVCE
jgi:TolB-like protein/DNA-binding winged helix-turn-helix (wHTH) protein/tetratricopeptide (TPR) repeat protein